MPKIVSISMGYWNGAAITEDGDLYAWGINDKGQLGHSSTTFNQFRGSYTAIPTKVSGITNIISASVIRFESLAAVSESGDLYVLGHNRYGQLGLGDNEDRHTPTKVPGLPRVTAVSSNEHIAIITEDGNLYTWGTNNQGQLGYPESDPDSPSLIRGYDSSRTDANRIFDGKKVDFYTPGSSNRVPRAVSGLSDVVAISVAYGHTAAITANGDLYTWGLNTSGELGYESSTVISFGSMETIYFSFTGIPTKVPDLQNIVSVSVGRHTSSAVTADGGLYTWGNAGNNLLGDGTSENRNTPVRITQVH